MRETLRFSISTVIISYSVLQQFSKRTWKTSQVLVYKTQIFPSYSVKLFVSFDPGINSLASF